MLSLEREYWPMLAAVAIRMSPAVSISRHDPHHADNRPHFRTGPAESDWYAGHPRLYGSLPNGVLGVRPVQDRCPATLTFVSLGGPGGSDLTQTANSIDGHRS